jgi:endonuclease III-like uncharacterized protein
VAGRIAVRSRGRYLTQNANGTIVERAFHNLRSAHLLAIEGIRDVCAARLERLIGRCGYFRQKAKPLKMFVKLLDARATTALSTRWFSRPADELLALNEVGPETQIHFFGSGNPILLTTL